MCQLNPALLLVRAMTRRCWPGQRRRRQVTKVQLEVLIRQHPDIEDHADAARAANRIWEQVTVYPSRYANHQLRGCLLTCTACYKPMDMHDADRGCRCRGYGNSYGDGVWGYFRSGRYDLHWEASVDSIKALLPAIMAADMPRLGPRFKRILTWVVTQF